MEKLRNYYECAITTPALPSNKPWPIVPPTPPPSPSALDKDLDDISCGGQSGWDAIIGGSSDHYARTQDQHYCPAEVKCCSENLCVEFVVSLIWRIEWMRLWAG